MKATPIRSVAFDARYVNDRCPGIGRHAYHLLEALTRLDPGRRYLAFYHPAYPNTRFDLERLGERPNVELRPIRLPLYWPGEQLIWPGLLRQTRADLFHSPYVVLPLLTRTRLAMTVHDLIYELHPESRPRNLLQRFYFPVTRLSLGRADLVFTVTESSSRDIQSYYHLSRERIRVIGNATDPAFRRERCPARLEEVREHYGLPEHFMLTLGVGRPYKNVEALLEAFARLDPALAPPLVIGGERDPWFPDRVGPRMRALRIASRVFRPGAIREADLPAVYSLADLFVFPSLIEGFGLPPLEAMACGTPVLASHSPAVREVVDDAALAFDARDPEQLATVLSRALADPSLRAALSRRGLERVRAFNWESVARKALQAYATLEAPGGEESRSSACDTPDSLVRSSAG